MPDEPSILEIDPTWRRGIEDMGSKPKFWFRYQDGMWLYKQARENTGEHWAEKVASEIAELIGLPTHETLIATYEGRVGCAVRSFLKPGQTLIHGNELLAGAIEGYDKSKHRGRPIIISRISSRRWSTGSPSRISGRRCLSGLSAT
jgi:hypothetical protein